jgi:alpha-L-fucosidase
MPTRARASRAERKPDTAAQDHVPSYLAAYADLYAREPRKAARQWFSDAGLGLFVHFALASVLERGKPEYLELTKGCAEQVELSQLPASHRARLGISDEDMAQVRTVHEGLMKRFRAEHFDANAICDLAIVAEMRYVNFTTKHLGRLAMYRTRTTDFTSVNSPAGRDLVAEMAEACAERGLGLFLYVPPETARTDGDFFEVNRTIIRELLTQYGPIAGIWFDGIGAYRKNPENYSRLPEIFALIRRLQPQCLISFKEGALGQEDFISPEHFLLPTPVPWDTAERQARWNVRLQRWEKRQKERWNAIFRHKPAEINTTMQECFNRDGKGQPGGWINDNSARHLSADEVMFLIRVARSLDANLLINIGPRADGSIHPADKEALREVGHRLRQREIRGAPALEGSQRTGTKKREDSY